MGLRALALVLLLGATVAIASSSARGAAPGQSSGVVAAAHAGQLSSDGSAGSGGAGAATAPSNGQPLTALGHDASSPSSDRPSASNSPSSGIGSGIATMAASTPGADWLSEINRYRAAAGLAPVRDRTSWDAGILAHLNYVAKAPKSDLSGQYASLHTENPTSTLYTAAGAREAGRSDLYFGATGLTPTQFVDGWLSAPFHAIGILRARLTEVAFASTGGSAAGLDVISGLDDDGPAVSGPILFPGNGMTTNLASYTGSESPDPLETCGWTDTHTSYGLPLIALLPSAPVAGLTAQVVAADGTVMSTANGQLCLVDEHTYRSSDSVYGPTGQEILRGDHAVLLVARSPYVNSRFTVTINQPGRAAITWSFTVAR